MVSVIIPLYNKAKQIEKTLNSVLSQTYQDFEVIVIDDGSTDGSLEIVKRFEDSRIRVISQRNAGVSAARNRGIEEAKGEFVAFLDADDEWDKDYLSVQIGLTNDYPECNVFATNYEFHDAAGNVSPTIIRNIPFCGETGILTNYFEVASNSNPPLWTSAVMATKQALNEVRGFPIGVKSGEDLLIWAKLASQYKIAYCREPKATYNVEGYNLNEKPKRIPAEVDFVGNELKKLYHQYQIPKLRAYRSLWHKMRASIYMRLRQRKNAYRETLTAIRLHPTNYKLYLYLILNSLPSKLQPF